ncbi:MAG TPA: right-handed parallel beta-helix repeat-containing protein, partial [Armatimonadota bacterium]
MNRVIRIQPQALRWLVVLSVLLALTASPAKASPLYDHTLLVNNSGDAGSLPCTGFTPNDCDLRSALQLANTHFTESYFIWFASDMTINLTSELPGLNNTNKLVVDGQGHVVKIDGQNAVYNIFYITGANISILNLRMYRSKVNSSQIYVDGGSSILIASNIIGASEPMSSCADGSPDSYGGVFVSSPIPQSTQIVDNIIRCNLGNPGNGVDIYYSDQVVVGINPGSTGETGNVITDNHGDGVLDQYSSATVIAGNSISNNDQYGIAALASTAPLIQQNTVDQNTSYGVFLSHGPSDEPHGTVQAVIGCAADGASDDGNVITRNSMGIVLDGANTHDNLIACNTIGFPGAGNTYSGVMVTDAAHHNQIGQFIEHTNLISSNGEYGVLLYIDVHDNTVSGNIIGLDKTLTVAQPNALGGILLDRAAAGNIIGIPDNLHSVQYIAGNTGPGIFVYFTNGTIINERNWIGSETPGLGNTGDGILIHESSRTSLLGSFIRNNGGAGISVTGSGNSNRVIPF